MTEEVLGRVVREEPERGHGHEHLPAVGRNVRRANADAHCVRAARPAAAPLRVRVCMKKKYAYLVCEAPSKQGATLEVGWGRTHA